MSAIPNFSGYSFLPSPTSCSRRLVLLKFIRAYKTEHSGASPSLGEMSAALGTSRAPVKYHLRRLEADGLIKRVYGARRDILLLDDPEKLEADAVRLLRDRGWTVNDDIRQAAPPLTNSDLPLPPGLDDIPGAAGEGLHHDSNQGNGAA